MCVCVGGLMTEIDSETQSLWFLSLWLWAFVSSRPARGPFESQLLSVDEASIRKVNITFYSTCPSIYEYSHFVGFLQKSLNRPTSENSFPNSVFQANIITSKGYQSTLVIGCECDFIFKVSQIKRTFRWQAGNGQKCMSNIKAKDTLGLCYEKL